MKVLRSALSIAFLFLVASGGTACAQPGKPSGVFEKSLDARARGQVHISSLAGRVKIHGWDRREIKISAPSTDDGQVPQIRSDGQRIWIEVGLESDPAEKTGAIDLEVFLPHASSVNLRSASASVELEGLTGPVEIETASGPVRLSNESGSTADHVTITTVSGDISISASSRILRVRSVSGGLEVYRPAQDLEAETASGDIVIATELMRESRLESGSGTIRVQGPISETSRLLIISHEGLIELRLPAATEALFDLQSRFGSIVTDVEARGEAQETRNSFHQIFGQAPAQIFARNFLGDIHLSRQDS